MSEVVEHGLDVEAVLDRLPLLAGIPASERMVTPLPGGLTNVNLRVRAPSSPRPDLDVVVRIHPRPPRCSPSTGTRSGSTPVARPLPGWVLPSWITFPEKGSSSSASFPDARMPRRTSVSTSRPWPTPSVGCTQPSPSRPDSTCSPCGSAIWASSPPVASAFQRGMPGSHLPWTGCSRPSRPTQPLVPCHNDLLAANFLDHEGRVSIIDYEYSGNNEATFELGNPGPSHSPEHLEWFGGEYFLSPGAADPVLLARAELWAQMARHGWTLWGVIQAAVSDLDEDFWAGRWGSTSRRWASSPPVASRDLLDVVGGSGDDPVLGEPGQRAAGFSREPRSPQPRPDRRHRRRRCRRVHGIPPHQSGRTRRSPHRAGPTSCGTTWHAAGLVGLLRASESGTRLVQYSADLYARLEGGNRSGDRLSVVRGAHRGPYPGADGGPSADGGQRCGLRPSTASWSRPSGRGDLPHLRTDDLLGGSGCPAMAWRPRTDGPCRSPRGARARRGPDRRGRAGARRGRGRGRVRESAQTTATAEAEIVVNCAGQWAKAVGAMAGVNVPLHSAEHFYVVTDQVAGVGRDTPILRDPDGWTYVKEEVGGLVVGGLRASRPSRGAHRRRCSPPSSPARGGTGTLFSILMDSAL